MTESSRWDKKRIYVIVFLASVLGTVLILLLLFNIYDRKQEGRVSPVQITGISENEIDPEVWGQNFPFEYETFKRTQEDYGKTKYGGSTPYSKLERYPAMKRLWAGYSFGKDHNEERGHYYAAIDQANTLRTQIVDQPGACANCHAAEAPGLIREMGWETFNATPYNDLKPKLMTGSSCSDCHDPSTMDLRITRPAFKFAMQEAGVDLSRATRQEMRSYVCGQCHVEYYFKGKNKVLTFPWSRGRNIDSIEVHYDTYAFNDWIHSETGAPMLKMQHPEFELWGTGIHAASGVSCADCHMPYIRRGSIKISDHWIRSPLQNPNASCQTCHHITQEELEERVLTIQDRTAGLLRRSEEAILDAMDAIKTARDSGIGQEKLDRALTLHRRAQMRWDFVSSENSTGFHSSQEAARILAESIDMARQAQIAVMQVNN
ncbi:ammonia-forming cytochrome c nitrite reductase subunit c552 [bacterium]|nr:ammonia-forming cytochrome c nitrite reductase subunit c552 [bacterium]